MVYLSEKKIKGKKYLYLVKSIRLPNGKTRKIMKTISRSEAKEKNPEKKYENYFLEKERGLNQKWALKKFKTDDSFTEEQIKKIESMKIDYKKVIKKLTKTQLKDAFDRFIANFTYESNALEGNSLTLKDVAIVMFENRSIEGKDMREIYETRNSRKVMELLLKNKFKINHKDIKKMHKIMMKDIPTPTGYKKVPNFLLGRSVETTPPENVEKEMDKLIKWHDNNPEKLHPLQLAAVFHGKFEKIHPFEDGNGRAGRFLSNAILLNKDYPPLIIRKSQRTSYLKTLEDFDRGYTKNLERLFLEKYKDTFKKFFEVYIKYI